MTDEEEGLVILFPENFPDWALTPDERRAKRRLRLIEGEKDEDECEEARGSQED
jgi:hypothetical protein